MLPRLLAAALACPLVLGVLAGCADAQTAAVEVGEVTRRTVTEVVEAPAVVVAKASATLTAPADGTLESLTVKDGDRVSAGQVVARIDSPQAHERLRQARAAAAAGQGGSPSGLASGDLSAEQKRLDDAAEASFRTAREAARDLPDADRRREALAEIARSESAYRSARAASAEAVDGLAEGVRDLNRSVTSLQRAQTAQARAAVALAEQAVSALTVRAPIDGTVYLGEGGGAGGGSAPDLDALPESVRGQAQQLLGGAGGKSGAVTGGLATGSPVRAGATLLTVTDDSALSLAAEVDETDVLLIRPGVRAKADVEAVPGARYNASVLSVGLAPSVGGNTGGSVTYPVRLALAAGRRQDGQPAPRPRPGMSAVVRFDVRTAQDALSVPSSAIVRDGGRDAVWVLEDGRARRRVVRLGAQGDSFAEVTEGLALGDRVVVHGADKVADDQQLP